MMTDERKVIEVYAELTPNPNTMKFVSNRVLLSGMVVEYFSKQEAIDCPLAYRLFDFSGVKAVFITSNFVTVTKDAGIDWYDITNILREFVKGFLESGEKLFLKSPVPNTNGIAAEKESSPQQPLIVSEGGEVVERIKQMLEDYVRPAVEQDGGAIHFKSFAEGILTLTLKGSCSGCPSSTVTLKAGIENLMKKMVPEVQKVVAEGEE